VQFSGAAANGRRKLFDGIGGLAAGRRPIIDAARRLGLTGIAVLLGIAFATTAAAQTTGGWTLNIDNTGFNPIPAGSLLPYRIRIDNNGNVPTPETTIVFTVPATTIYLGTDGLTCSPAPDPGEPELTEPLTVTCDVPALAPAGLLNATVNLRPMQAGSVTLEGTIQNGGPTFSRLTTVEEGADLQLSLAVASATVQAGSIASFSASVTNAGPYDSQGAQVVIPLPAGLSPDVTMPAECAYVAPNIICDLPGTIAVGASVDLDFASQVTSQNASTITIAAEVSATTPRDGVAGNDGATVDIEVTPGTDVSIVKTRTPPGLVLVGQEVTFTLEAGYAGDPPTQAEISDTLPANYQFVSVDAGTGWTCPAPAGQTVSCSYSGTVAEAANYTAPITITVEAISDSGGEGVTNTATITSAAENAGAEGNNSGTDGAAFIAVPTIDLVALKSGPPRGLVTVGNSYDFSLRARNDGNAGFSGPLTITDHLPAGLTVTNIAPPAGWNCDPAPPIEGPAEIVCTTDMYTSGSPLAPTDLTDSIVLTALVTAPGSISNGMTVSFDDYLEDDEEPGNNTTAAGMDSAAAGDWADLYVVKTLTSPAGTITAGDEVEFSIEVVNAGDAVAENLVLDDRLSDIVAGPDGGEPTGVDFSTAEGLSSGLSCTTAISGAYSRDLQCTIAALPVCAPGTGECPVITVRARPGDEGAKTNTAIAFSTTVPDNDTDNNSDSVDYTVAPRTDVTVEKSSPTVTAAAAGQELIYVVEAMVPLTGLSGADNVTITDTLPTGVRFVSAEPTSGSCAVSPAAGDLITDPANQTLECNLGSIANGSLQTVTVRVIPTTALVNSSITNGVTVSTTTPETDAANNTDELTLAVAPPVLDLIVSKTDDPLDPVEIDTDTTYIVEVRNSGPSDAFNVVLTDTLPESGFVDPVIVSTTPGGTCSTVGVTPGVPSGSVSCDIPYLAAGQTFSLTLDMTSMERGRHRNTVSVTSDETAAYESPTDNNSSYEDTTVRVRSDLSVTKEASVTVVDLRQEFFWTITVTSQTGAGLDVAEWVTLTDTLPEGMELTRVPETSLADPDACTGVVGGTVISCELGDIEVGDSVVVTLWVKITDVDDPEQPVTNSATASTLSFDQNFADNTDEDSVTTVLGNSISGTVYRDFNGNGSMADTGDTGIEGVAIRVSGIASHDGAEIARTVQTDAQGNYVFELLPPGTYSVFWETIGEPHLVDGEALPGSGDGTAVANGVDRIDNIVITNAVAGADHDFTRVPTARIGLGKTAGPVAVQDDGSYHVIYTIAVENLSLEPLENITITDTLDDASQNFGAYSGGAAPAEGEYRVLSTTSSAPFGTLNGAFTGVGTDTLLSGGTLDPGETQTVSYTVHVNPVVPRPVPALEHTNQAQVSGDGAYSGQTSGDNPQLTDLSHNTANPDPDGDGIANETDNNTPTSVTPPVTPDVTLVKLADPVRESGEAEVGDRIDYSFTVTNTGNTPLLDVKVTDPMVGLAGLPDTVIARLDPDAVDNTTFTAHYILTQADLDRGSVDNTASVVGQWGEEAGGAAVTTSDTDSATVTALSEPGITVAKAEVSNTIGDPRTAVGDTIRYSFTVTNTGNTTLREVTLADVLSGIAPDPVGAFELGTLAPGDEQTVYADYAVVQADIDRGNVPNTVTASGVYGGADTEISSDPSSVTVPVFQQPGLVLTKVVDASTVNAVPRAGDIVDWTVTALNTGNVTLTDLSVDDPLPGATVSPASLASLAPGASFDFIVSAPLTQAYINGGEVVNQAEITFTTPDGPDTEQSGNDPEEPPEVTVTPLPQVPSIALRKQMITSITADPQAGDGLRYRFTIRNTGNVPLSSLDLDEDLDPFVMDAASATALAAATLQPQNAAGDAVDTEIAVEGAYTLTQDDIDAGLVENQALVQATPTAGPTDPVTDTSGTDFGNDDPTVTSLDRMPEIRLVKTITDADLSSPPAAGDVITYGFAVHNIGNVTLDDIGLTELVGDIDVVNSAGWTGPLTPGAVNTDAFTATYELVQADIDRGSFANAAEVAGTGPGDDGEPQTVTDRSGTALDNDSDTVQSLTRTSSLSIVKSATPALSTPPAAGDVIDYEFVVTNTGNVTLTDVVLDDPLPDLVLTETTIPELLPGADNAVTLTGTYSVKQSDIQAGEVRNQASASGTFTDPVTSTPQTVGPVLSEEIVVPLDQIAGIAVVKSGESDFSDPPAVGETISFEFVVTNTGNLNLTGVRVDDPLAGISPNFYLIGDLAPGASVTVGPATYNILQSDIDTGEVLNQATATGTYDDGAGPTSTIDLSGPANDSDDELVVPVAVPRLTVSKTGTFDNGGGYTQIGDHIDFEFVVTNTGNVTLEEVTPEEVSFTFGGSPAAGDLETLVPGPQTMAPGSSVTFTTRYLLTQSDINNGSGLADGVENMANATSLYDGTEVVAPTVSALVTLPVQQPSSISVVKRAEIGRVLRGGTVPYSIVVTNGAPGHAVGMVVTDTLPSGFRFVEGSASHGGVPVTPVVSGRDVVFENVAVDAGSSVEIVLRLQALPSTGPGRYVNVVRVRDADGRSLASAEAAVDIEPEAVFDCAEILGRVFDDGNRNGWHDDGEQGLPGVRLATVNGELITTDEHGRFSVPCAALPNQQIGSNFVLKLDERTLPIGYAPTTANPEAIRLTAGKMSRINFGASVGRRVDINLSGSAFAAGSAEPGSGLRSSIGQLVQLLKEERSVVRLTYRSDVSDRQLALERLRRLDQLIREQWRGVGSPYDLVIDSRTVKPE
jgi:uncharacterized repeat protein (TIGR01451 family)